MPQCTIAHSESYCPAFSKHFTPSSKLNPKHQFKPKLNQRCASGDGVEIARVCVPRLNWSIHLSPSPRADSYAQTTWAAGPEAMQFSRALIIGRPGGGASRGIVDCRNTDSRAAGYLAPAGTTVAVCSVQGHPKVSPAEAEADDRKDIVVLNIVPYGPGLVLWDPSRHAKQAQHCHCRRYRRSRIGACPASRGRRLSGRDRLAREGQGRTGRGG